MDGEIAKDRIANATSATITRLYGWLTLAVMISFLINTVLTFWVGMPGFGALFGLESSGEPNEWSGLQAIIFMMVPAVTVLYILRTPGQALRDDANLLSNANAFLIRAVFWIVLLVGLSDASISFIRVEGLLPALVGDELTQDLGRSHTRGRWVHMPIAVIGIIIAACTRSPGFIWLTALVVGAELLIVFSRFILSYEQSFMGDLVRFWYAALFLFSSAYTLREDGHVRIDLFYAGMARRTQGKINATGSIILGMTLCWTILLLGMWGKSSVITGPLLVFETTQTGFGMYVKYLMAGFLAIFAISMMIQFVISLFQSVADARDEPGGHHKIATAALAENTTSPNSV